MSKSSGWSWRLAAPDCWPLWLGLGLLRLGAAASYPTRLRMGRVIGRVLRRVMSRRRRIAEINLRVCFPEAGEAERERWLREHFEAIGIAVLEMGATWWAPDHKLGPLARTVGMEHMEAALAKGRGAIGASAHLLSTEMGLRLMAVIRPGHVVYRPHNHPVLEYVIQHGRTWHGGVLVDRSDFRAIVQALRDNNPLWFPTDQDHGPRHSVFVPFFGHDAATITSVSRLAKLTRSPVVPFYPHRLAGDAGYELVFLPELEDFPSGDDTADAARLNSILEDQIRRYVDQYLWIHRRFKTRPPGEPDIYEGM